MTPPAVDEVVDLEAGVTPSGSADETPIVFEDFVLDAHYIPTVEPGTPHSVSARSNSPPLPLDPNLLQLVVAGEDFAVVAPGGASRGPLGIAHPGGPPPPPPGGAPTRVPRART